MAKDKLTDYDATASNNTDVGGVSVAEGMLPSGVNNAIRELMSHQADAFGAGTPLYVDQTNNRLGVGNAAPTVPLDVTGAAKVSGDLTVDTSTLKVDSTNNRVGIANASPSVELDVTGAAKVSGDLTVDTDTLHVDSTNNRVGIGETSPSAKLHISGSNTPARFGDDGTGYNLDITHDTASGITTLGQTNSGGDIKLKAGSATGLLFFETSGSERMRIDSSGNLLVGTTNTAPATQNSDLGIAITGSEGRIFTCTTGHHDFNRTSDGEILRFRSAANTEGSISVSGTTVSYNGGHLARWSRLADDSKDTSIVKGTVMTNLDQMAVWHHEAVAETYYVEGDELPEITPATYYTEDDTLPEGASVGDEKTAAVYAQIGDEKTPAVDAYTEDNEQLNCMAVSSVEGDANVAGVFVNWDEEDDFNDMNIAMTGDMVIRIAQGTTVARGDLLMSAGDGTAKPQGDDIVRSKTIAKVTSTNVSHTYDDGSYLVPCVLMAC